MNPKLKPKFNRRDAETRRKPAAPIVLWAVINRGNRGDWINYSTIRGRRQDAWAEYVSWWSDPKVAVANKRRKEVRLAKVLVSELRGTGAEAAEKK